MNRIEIGYVARAHGLRGEVRVHTHAAESTLLLEVERAWFAGEERRIESARATSGGILLTLEGIPDRTAAEGLRGAPVEVLRDDIPLAEDEVLVGDLIGCAAVTPDGASLGRVVDVLHAVQDLLVLHDDTHERLLPAVPEFLREVDLAARRIVVEPPEDLPADPLPQPRAARPEPTGRR